MSYSVNHFVQCVHPSTPEQQMFVMTKALVHQGSRIDEQRCEFPLPLKVSLLDSNNKKVTQVLY